MAKARVLTFTQTANNLEELDNVHNKLMPLLESQPSLDIVANEIKVWNMDMSKYDRPSYQIYERRYYVQKTGRKLTWNDVYGLVNSVKATSYSFKTMRIREGKVWAVAYI
jgi:hypothetical protein